MSKKSNFILKKYSCRICNEVHEIKLDRNLFENITNFPFSHVFLHGDLRNILTTLYLDKNFEIRGVDVHKLSEDDIFSKDQVIAITDTLMEELETLREENKRLIGEIKKLKDEKSVKLN